MTGHDYIKRGFAARLTFFNEKVRLRNLWYKASINRIPLADRLPGDVEINPDEGAVIKIDIKAPEPKPGEVLLDTSDRKHRIGEVKMVEHAWHCRCQTEP